MSIIAISEITMTAFLVFPLFFCGGGGGGGGKLGDASLLFIFFILVARSVYTIFIFTCLG